MSKYFCRSQLYPVYTIQPVVKSVVQIKPGVQLVWQPRWTNSHCSFNRLSIDNRFDNRLYCVYIQTFNRLSIRFDNRLYRV